MRLVRWWGRFLGNLLLALIVVPLSALGYLLLTLIEDVRVAWRRP